MRLKAERAAPVVATEPQRPRLMQDALKSATKMLLAPPPTDILLTGFPDIDRELKPLGEGEITMLAADSGVGKSTLSTQIAFHAAACKYGVVYLNLEMAEEMYGLRTMANYAGVSVKRAYDRTASPDEFNRLFGLAQELTPHSRRIVLGDQSNHRAIPAIKKLCADASEWFLNQGERLRLIVVDHVLQVLVSVKNDKDAEGKARADLLKELADTHKCHVLALVHVTREGSKTGKMPTKNQLASSAWFDRHADNIWVFHQARKPDGTFAGGNAQFSCQKARWGSPFSAELEYRMGFFWPWSLLPRGT